MDDTSKYESSSHGKQVFNNPKYKSSFLSQVNHLFRSKSLTDVVLISSDNETIECHKIVLAAFSPYFAAMFSSNFIESLTNKVNMSDTNSITLKSIIDYAYSGTLELSLGNVQDIFSLASLLQLSDVIDACVEYMNSRLDANNVLSVYLFANCHQTIELAATAKEYINKHITEITNTIEFLELKDLGSLCEVLSSDELSIVNEAFILEVIFKWIAHCHETRVKHFERLFTSCVRMELIEIPRLKEIYKSHYKVFSSSQNCVTRIESYLNSNDKLKMQTTKIRSGMNKPDYCFLLLGGNCDLDDGFYVNCFNPDNGKKFMISKNFQEKLKFVSKGYFHIENPGCCVTEDGRIFVAGGNWIYHEYKHFSRKSNTKKQFSKKYNNSLDNDSDSFDDGEEMLCKDLYEYDKIHDSWIKRNSMLFGKANFSLCSMGDRLYSFGGIIADQDQVDVVEYYEINENKWYYACSMPHRFIAGCVVCHEENFYVLGGRSGVGRFDNCFCYTPGTGEWKEIKKMNIGRFNFGACVIDSNLIYIFGGQRYNESEQSYYTREALDSVEIYNVTTGEWQIMSEKMPQSLYNTGVCKYDDQEKCLYVCGTTECTFSGSTIMGFMFTSVFRLELTNHLLDSSKWTIVEQDVSDIKSNYRCVAVKLNTCKLYKCEDNFSSTQT